MNFFIRSPFLLLFLLNLQFSTIANAQSDPAAARSQMALQAFWGQTNYSDPSIKTQINALLTQGYTYEGLSFAIEVGVPACSPGCTYKYLVIQTMIKKGSNPGTSHSVAGTVLIRQSESPDQNDQYQITTQGVSAIPAGALDQLTNNLN